MSMSTNPSQQTASALAARRERTEAALKRVRECVERMVKTKSPITVAAVARTAEVSRTFLYEHPEARQLVDAAAATAAGRRIEGRRAEAEALEASWRERALNSEDALKAAHAEILRQRERIGELLGQVRDLQTGWSEEDLARIMSENVVLKRTVRDLDAEKRALADKLAAARTNNRFADKRCADLEARIVELEAGGLLPHQAVPSD